MIKDVEARELLIHKALELIFNNEELKSLGENIYKLAEKNSADRIVDEIEKLIKNKF